MEYREDSEPKQRLEPEDQADDIIRQAEMSKATMFNTRGTNNDFYSHVDKGDRLAHVAVVVDDSYIVIGVHVDPNLQQKICRGEYIDFACLLPKKKFSDEQRMELINRGGQSFFVSVSDNGNGITSFSKWEQAFRIFMNIYTRRYPERATELVQYNHIIFTASSSYIWENVYMYDKEFRAHMSRFPGHSWAIILQQAWTIYLKDRLRSNNQDNFRNNGQKCKKDVCKRFNKGLCTAGLSCKYDHWCIECERFGHGAHICRRRSSNQNGNASSGPGSGHGSGAPSNNTTSANQK